MPLLKMALAFVLPWSLVAVAPESPRGPVVQQTADGRRGGLRQIMRGHYVYLHTDDTPGVSSTVNSGIIVTNDGVVVVDALSSEAIARQVRAAISGVTAQPVQVLVSSTFHGRFTGGNAVYQDALNIGHEGYRADLVELLRDASPEEQAARLPDQTYRDRVTVYVGGKEIQILHLGRAHTRGDSIVFVPADRTRISARCSTSTSFRICPIATPVTGSALWKRPKRSTLTSLFQGMGFFPATLGTLGKVFGAIGGSCWTYDKPFRSS